MTPITRRDTFALGAGLAAAAVLTTPARAAIPMADVPEPKFPIEAGAKLRVLRPAKFVDPDEAIFTANSRSFTAKTGVEVRVDYVAWADMPVQTAVTANTGAGPDIILGFGPDPHIYADKVAPLTDLAEYLGKKYGGWHDLATLYGKAWKGADWIGLPMGGTAGPANYRISWLKEAGFDKIPNDLQQFLTLCRNLKKIGHPCGFTLAHAPGDAPNYANWLLWAHGAKLVDEAGHVTLDTPETREALEYGRAMYETMIPGTMSWNGSSNNQAFAAGEISLTQNGVSIYYAAKTSKDPKQNAVAVDMDHASMPFGRATKSPVTALVLNAMLFKHCKFPNAGKEYLRFMMEAPQYDPWLTGSLGYWSQPLKAYAASAVWASDPKLEFFKGAMDTPFNDGYAGPVNAAAGSVLADWVLVDMFARVATGEATPEASIRTAARAATRYYK
jgi:multiple sugar transport system substrate-binding protein